MLLSFDNKKKHKEESRMTLIACTDPCVYQRDGYSSLSRAASFGEPGPSGCVNFVPTKPSQQSGHGLPDVGHPDQL